MEIFGIGPLELLLIVLIALIVLGPKEMLKTAQKAAGWIRKIRQSEIWSTTKEVMDIPNQVMHVLLRGYGFELQWWNAAASRWCVNTARFHRW